jgi:hypothetical protein
MTIQNVIIIFFYRDKKKVNSWLIKNMLDKDLIKTSNLPK